MNDIDKKFLFDENKKFRFLLFYVNRRNGILQRLLVFPFILFFVVSFFAMHERDVKYRNIPGIRENMSLSSCHIKEELAVSCIIRVLKLKPNRRASKNLIPFK